VPVGSYGLVPDLLQAMARQVSWRRSMHSVGLSQRRKKWIRANVPDSDPSFLPSKLCGYKGLGRNSK